jgi:hypothetical protein
MLQSLGAGHRRGEGVAVARLAFAGERLEEILGGARVFQFHAFLLKDALSFGQSSSRRAAEAERHNQTGEMALARQAMQ